MKIGQFRQGTTPNRLTTLKQIVGKNAGMAGIFGQHRVFWVFWIVGFFEGRWGCGVCSQSDCMPSHTQKKDELEIMPLSYSSA